LERRNLIQMDRNHLIKLTQNLKGIGDKEDNRKPLFRGIFMP
jgi:hypothetical protein